MQRLRSRLFFTQLCLLFLVARLVFPLTSGAYPFRITTSLQTLHLFVASIVLFVLPGWRWSVVFFRDDELNGWERWIMSIAISICIIMCSAVYMRLARVPLYPEIMLIVLTGWSWIAMIIAFALEKHRRSSTTEAEMIKDLYDTVK